MIKIFRKTRQKLLSESKFSKYMLYAIGEIVLVVIGILIAVQFNNYYEEKKEREKEQAFLKEINLDFKSNKVQLDSIINYNKVSLNAGVRMLELMPNFDFKNPQINSSNSNVRDSLAYYNQLVWRNKTFNPKDGSIEALLNSSSFDLIKNDMLRRRLISWKDVLADYSEEEEFARDFLFHEFGPWARESFDPDIADDPDNTKAFFSKRHRNFLNQRAGDLANILTTVENEGVIAMIDDIIRLTETQAND